MQMTYPYDAASIAARCTAQDVLMVAAREQIIHEARRARRYHVLIAVVGHLLVRLGQWLQTMAHRPTYQEETVQWSI